MIINFLGIVVESQWWLSLNSHYVIEEFTISDEKEKNSQSIALVKWNKKKINKKIPGP